MCNAARLPGKPHYLRNNGIPIKITIHMTICNSPQTYGLDLQIIRPRRKLTTNWHVFGVILLCLAFSRCKVALVPPYDAGVEQQIVNTAKMNDRLYLEMQDDPVAD